MVVSLRTLLQPLTGFSTVSVLALSLVAGAAPALAQTPEVETAPSASVARPADGSLSIASATQMMSEAEAAIANQDFVTAEAKLKEARETLNQLSTYYQELAQMFVGVDTQINRSNRERALETAQMRDQATYQLALVYRAQDRTSQAVPLLMEILRSQQPTRELGQRAYQQLFELGFVEEPYAGRAASSSNP
ncbi:hypothetical protein [Nodosilinea sp. P-1105]|uniref:hypothetical protein n=1 Tax=Nodosilinea sp. P-1105 TaxID=2546229 RepID=UPI00146D82F1|nr:hypothetical protein [Nodosilinea sp. P-1105]NMF86577.1 hypothetical protein [Nodosilinea sp. P-1105]